jgi:hypothetical protein
LVDVPSTVWYHYSWSGVKEESEMASKKGETFADRFMRLKGDESFQSLSDRMAKKGLHISPQSLFKWSKGGGVTPENLMLLAQFFDMSPGALFFGEDSSRLHDVTEDELVLIKARRHVPDRFRPGLDRDILLVGKAYATDRTLLSKIEAALRNIEKGAA